MATIRLTFHFDPNTDADLLQVIQGWPPGHRSQRLKDWLRRAPDQSMTLAARMDALDRRVTALETNAASHSRAPDWDADALKGLLDDFQEQGGTP